MKTYLINLPKNKERLASMDRQLRAFGIEYEKFAIVAKDISKKDWKNHFDAFHSFLAAGRRLTIPELGCTISHLEAYRRMLKEDIPYALILEDDVIFSTDFPERLKEVEQFMDPERSQLILFSWESVPVDEKRKGIYRIDSGLCTDAYCITRAAAKALLKSNYPIVAVADWYSRWVKRGLLELYRCFPISARQDKVEFPSDLGMERFKRTPFLLIPVHKAIRAIGLFLDYLWFKILGR